MDVPARFGDVGWWAASNMMVGRRVVARIANAGLIASGLALVVIFGTGGTRLDLQLTSIGLREAAGPLTFFCFFAALRLLAGARYSGLESRLVTFLARQGLPPRDAPATVPSSARAGALLGAGLGFVAASADLVRLIAAVPRPWPAAEQTIGLALTVFGLGLTLGAAVGALVGVGVILAATAIGRSLGRYDAGRITVALLVVLAPGLMWLAPSAGRGDHTPRVLLIVAASVPLSLALVFVLAPTAVQRARRGRWGLAVGGAVAVAAAVVCAAVVALSPGGISGPSRDATYPNVLLVSISGLRSDFVSGAEGEGRFTPALAALAQRGAIFRMPVSPSTALAPAAASLLTGLYPATHGLRGPGWSLRPALEGLPVALAAHGFRTAAFVSCAELNGRETGLADLFERYDDPITLREWLNRTVLGRLVVRRWGAGEGVRPRPGAETVDAFREWAAVMPRGPWFAWVEFSDPLWPRPQRAPPDSVRTYPGLDPRRPPPLTPAWAVPEDRERSLGDWLYGYIQAIRAADAAVAALQQIVAARGELQHTLIVVTAEQGAALGEGGVWLERGREPAAGVVLVPWIVAGPAVRSQIQVAGPCSLVDVAPTLLGLIGLGGGRSSEGEDLSRHLIVGGSSARDPRSGPVFSETAASSNGAGGRSRAVWFGRWKLLRLGGGRERLFIVEGGEERELLAPRGAGERQRAELSDMLTRRQAQEEDASASPPKS